jgi:hypothetical protein
MMYHIKKTKIALLETNLSGLFARIAMKLIGKYMFNLFETFGTNLDIEYDRYSISRIPYQSGTHRGQQQYIVTPYGSHSPTILDPQMSVV